jgi:maleylpyruvate isomerase
MFEAAARGEVGDQYEGGRAGREAEIEVGADRRWDALVEDVDSSIARLEAAMEAASDDEWATGLGELLAGVEPLLEFPHRRAREVEIHRLDLGLGATYEDWTDGFVIREWPLSIARLGDRLSGAGVRLVVDGQEVVVGDANDPVELRGTRAELLAWMTGRHEIPGAPSLTSWP